MTQRHPGHARAAPTEELRKYRHGLKVMSGGFTLSGGEPLMQHRFAVKLLAAAKAMGIHTALDTNGYYGDRLTDAELEAIDLVLLDIKAWDPERHQQLTGMDIGPTLEFARRLAARQQAGLGALRAGARLDRRPGRRSRRSRGFAAGLGNVERVDVLPFHQMGRFKWEKLGIEYALDDIEPPTHEAVERACALFRAAGLKTY